jgi:hypothetical protein
MTGSLVRRISRLECGANVGADVERARAIVHAYFVVRHHPAQATDQDRALAAVTSNEEWQRAFATVLDAEGGFGAVVSDLMLHPVHIHGCQFRIISQDGKPPERERAGWKDVTPISAGGFSEILGRFPHPAPRATPYNGALSHSGARGFRHDDPVHRVMRSLCQAFSAFGATVLTISSICWSHSFSRCRSDGIGRANNKAQACAPSRGCNCLRPGQTAISVLGANATVNANIMQGVVTGVGFIGAGAIMRQGDFTTGHATAASIWTVGIMGAAVGYGYYEIGIILAVANLAVLMLRMRPRGI